MDKQANILSSAGRFIAHNPGSTTAIGAGLGAGVGVAREAMRGDGQQKNYLAGGILGGARGAALGGGVALAGRAVRDTMLLSPRPLSGAGEIAKATIGRAARGVENFGRRQLHGLTGHGAGDNAYLDRIGIHGSGTSAGRARLDVLRAGDLEKHYPGSVNFDNVNASVKQHTAEGAIGDRLRERGMTHLPGTVKAFAKDPRGASKALWDQMRLGGKLGVVTGVGAPVLASAADLSRGDESAIGGRSLGEKGVRAAVNIGGGFALGGMPMMAGNLVGQGLEQLGGRTARALRGSRAIPAQME